MNDIFRKLNFMQKMRIEVMDDAVDEIIRIRIPLAHPVTSCSSRRVDQPPGKGLRYRLVPFQV